VENLYRHEAIVANVVREVDGSGSATTDLSLQDITPGAVLMQQWGYVEHGLPVIGDGR
jgi:hypothetical protein